MNASVPISSSEQRDIENEIISRRWDAIRRRLCSGDATRSFRANYRNENGLNAFHLLCANNDAPPDVVQKMASVDEAYLWAKTPVGDPRVYTRGHATALHLAAETGSVSTIKVLLDRMCSVKPWNADYVSDRHEATPLDILFESRLIPNYRLYSGEEREGNDIQSIMEFIKHLTSITCYMDMNAKMQDLWEKTNCFLHAILTGSTQGYVLPGGKQWFLIHEIVKNGGKNGIEIPMEVLLLAGKVYPELLKIGDENGDLPLHVAVTTSDYDQSCWRCGFSFQLEEFLKTLEKEEDDDGDRYDELIAQLPSVLDTPVFVLLQMFPDAAAMKNKNGKLPLHILCENILSPKVQSMPVLDIDDLLKANPGAFVAPDNSGSLPLHIIFGCLSECFSRCNQCIGDQSRSGFDTLPRYPSEFSTLLNYNFGKDRYIMMSLIESSPRNAFIVGNKVGRLPLHLLLDGGTPIRQKYKWDSHHRFQHYCVVPDTDVVQALIDKAPDTLDVPDPKTRLFPFMMAAVGKNSAIDCIYSLLRKSPANVRSGIVHSRYEKYLLRKMHEMKSDMGRERMYLASKIDSLEKENADLRSSNKKRQLGS